MPSKAARDRAAKVLLLCVVALACAGRSAVKLDSPDGYRRFLREHPDDARADEARQRLEDAEFEAACKLHTVLAYKRFLDEFSASGHAEDARSRLEALRFNAARDAGTAAALRTFLREHPDGAHRAEAEELLSGLELRELSQVSDPRALAQLASEGAGPQLAQAAGARLDDAAYEAALRGGAAALFAYLRDFPSGAHRTQVQVELLSRKLEGLLFSGKLLSAREEAGRNPLSSQVADLAERFERAEEEERARGSKIQEAQAAQAAYYLRAIEDLGRALSAPDPLDRWQAAEELSQHVSVDALDPLLGALRSARNPLIRERAFDALGAVLKALPPRIADYEAASRVEALRATGASADTQLAVAALLDLTGHLEEAAPAYQQAYDPAMPDPVVLRRWARLRLDKGQAFSAAVAARHLALWALSVARDEEEPGRADLGRARLLCAAADAARFSQAVVARAREAKVEFAEDLVEFARLADEARKLSEARLSDAELALAQRDPNALGCSDGRISERVASAAQARAAALEALPRKAPAVARALLLAASEKDPDPALRAKARALLPRPGKTERTP